jgi:Mrp family chromosome partitioning ATPase
VLVLNPGKTKLKDTIEAKNVLEFANSKIVGVILNVLFVITEFKSFTES